MPSMSALRYIPLFMSLAARLAVRSKTKMAIIGAVMHKLLRIAFGILKHRKPFDPKWGRDFQPALNH